jgi:small-conductance mechanosensitive channel
MDRIAAVVSDWGAALSGEVRRIGNDAAGPALLVQLAALSLAWIAAVLLARALEPPLEARLRSVKGRPRLLRILAVALRRLRPALFALLLWVAVAALEAMPGPGETALAAVVAQLATAWVLIAFASRVVRNRFAARAVAVAGWTVAALQILGLLDPLAAELDARALSFGSLRLSILAVVKAVAWFAVLLWLAGLVGGGVEHRLRRSTDLSPSLQVLVGKLTRIGLFLLAVVVSLTAVGLNLTAFTFLSGAIGLGLGFGLQKVVSNFVSGIIILADKSIKPGDVVEIGDSIGYVRNLSARFVSVRTRDGKEILIPNEDFVTEKVVNWSFLENRARLDVVFGVSYDSDPHEVRRIARAAAVGVPRVLADPAPVCHITGFGDSSVDFVLRFWIDDAKNGLTNVRGDVFLALWDALKAARIEIPFPQRVVTIRRELPD